MGAKYNIQIDQGATFRITVNVKDSSGNNLDLTGYTGRGKIRATPEDTTVVASFTVSVMSPATDGNLSISLSDAVTAAIPANDSESFQRRLTDYCYDIEIVAPGGDVTRIIEGAAYLNPEVTR